MDPYTSGNGWICVLSSAVDWPRLATHTWHLGGHQNFAAPLSDKESLLLLSQWIRLPRDDLHIRLAILWMGLRGEREGLPSMLATSFAEAAGVTGRQKWGLVLSSSARVSLVTYQTVVGVRYPELVTSMELVGGLASTFPRRAHNVEASSQCFGMFHVPTYMQLKILERL